MRGLLCMASVFAMAFCLQGGVLEDWIESTDYPEELQEWLLELREHPLDLNTASLSELSALPFIGRSGAKEIIRLRFRLGGLESMSSIDTLSILSGAQRSSLSEFTTVSRRYQALDRAVIRSSADASADSKEKIESSMTGYRLRADFRGGDGTAGYLYGIRRPNQTRFFEETSFGIELPRERMRPRLLVGDYQIETGTGLLFATAYGMGSWLSSTDALSVPLARGLVSRPSSSRLALQRGLALESSTEAITARLFGAINRLDASVNSGETVSITEGTSSSTELYAARKDQLEEQLIGADIEYNRGHYSLGATAYSAGFSPGFNSADEFEPMPRLEKSSLKVGSIHARVNYRSLQAISEVAGSSGGGAAHQSALTYQDERSAWSLYHIYADEAFYSPHSRLWGGFCEDAGNARQTGMRSMLRGKGYQLSIGGETERTPFRTSTSPLRKAGDQLNAQLRLYPGSAVELSGLINRRWNELTSAIDEAVYQRTDRGRLEVLFYGREEYKVRLELKSSVRNTGHQHALGTLAFFQMKTAVLGIQALSRITMWNVEHSDASMSLYESSVYGAYPLVSLFGTGRRITLQFSKGWNSLRLGTKLGHTVSESVNETVETVDFALEISYRQ